MAEALHLLRLAQASPDVWVELPGSAGRLGVVQVTRPQPGGDGACWYVCLGGTLILDLPHGDFVQLRVGESAAVPDGQAHTLTPVRQATVLRTRTGP
ncbi:hypothetical protein [Deinococcus sonorensis]|uniref:Cupin n=2 Tax=Deinococcus sonorensis TaxID=309891 RepID=A0AAU7UB06_9DEIO